jgi:hypothetical protein
MATTLEDTTFDLLLRSAIPLVVAPPGALPPRGPRLRGVTRVSGDRARVMLSKDAGMDPGVAFEFALANGDQSLNVEAAIDYVRTIATADMARFHDRWPHVHDSHGNLVVEAAAAGFSGPWDGIFYDHSLFRLFGLLAYGAVSPRFEDVYTFAGFMFRDAATCRIYVRATDNGDVYGLEIPLRRADGRAMNRFGGSLPQELVPLVREGHLLTQPVIDDRDDYCTQAFDMAKWIRPIEPRDQA